MVVCVSASELSTVTPPDSSCFCFSGSFVVRSGEMRSHDWPPLGDRYRYCEPRYSVVLSVGLTWIGVFQLKRSFFSPYRAYGLIARTWCVKRLTRPISPPWYSA